MVFLLVAWMCGAAQAAADDTYVFNVVQTIYARLPEPVGLYFGEAAYRSPAEQSPFFDSTHYALNGVPLEGAALACSEREVIGDYEGGPCVAVMLTLPPGTLTDGVAYQLRMDDTDLGTFVAAGIADRDPPSVTAVRAWQYGFEITFSKRMLYDSRCGADSYAGSAPAATDAAPVVNDLAHYSSPDAAFNAALHELHEMRSSADCTTFAFFATWIGAAAGTYDLYVEGATDVQGNAVPLTAMTVSFDDERAPSLLHVWSRQNDRAGDPLDLVFDEPLDRASVAELDGYRLNGAPLPAGATASCHNEPCTTVRLFVPAGAIRYGEPNTLAAPQIRDLAGKTIDPLANSWTWSGY